MKAGLLAPRSSYWLRLPIVSDSGLQMKRSSLVTVGFTARDLHPLPYSPSVVTEGTFMFSTTSSGVDSKNYTTYSVMADFLSTPKNMDSAADE